MHGMQSTALASVDVNLLVALQALLSERNVTRAAARLALSPSATSHALSRLRDLYGDPLLVRSGRRMDLTPRAVALLPQLERGLGDLAGTLEGEPAFNPATARRAFTLSMADYSQAINLGQLLGRLHRLAPGVTLSVVAYPNSLELLDAGTLDLALLANTASPPPGFSAQKLFDDGFVSVVRRDHPKVRARWRALPMATFLALDHLVVAPAGSPGSIVDSELERRGLSRRVAARVSSFLVVPLLVSQSDLVSTGPERLLRRMKAHYPIHLLQPPLALPRFDLHMVWHARRDHDPAHAWLRGLLAHVAA
jgi:DNA-binding transcriptional LysR family regulator